MCFMTDYRTMEVDTMSKSAPRRERGERTPGKALLAAALGTLCALLASPRTLLQDIERRTYDLRVRWHTPHEPARAPITIIAVDDESLARLQPAVGRWPWPRALFATVLDYASAASVIGIDILFPESDANFSSSDDALATQAAAHGRVVGASFFDQQTKVWIEPYEALRKNLTALGHVHVTPDPDGVARHHHLRHASPAGERPSLAAQLATLFSGGTMTVSNRPDPFLFCPLAQRPEMISIADVMTAWREEQQGQVPALSRTSFAGRIVLIGSLATGLPQDREVTPVSESEAGVIITAVATDNLLTGRYYREAAPWVGWLLMALLAALPLSVRASRPRAFLIITILFPIAYLGATLLAVATGRWMLPLVGPVLSWLVSATGLLVLYWFQERQRRLALQALETSKQRFTDLLVHDLRNRVYAGRASLQAVARQVRSPSGAAHPLVAVAEASLQGMLVEVNSLLDIRRMEEGRLRIRADAVDVAALLDEVVRDYTAAAAITRSTLAVRIAPDTPATFAGDRLLLVRLLSNLVINALQHGSAGAEITLLAARHQQAVRLTVANRGATLTPEARQSLFQPFHQVTSASAHGGTGLGLTLARLAAEAHGGTLDVESPWFETRDGVAIHVLVPLHREKEN